MIQYLDKINTGKMLLLQPFHKLVGTSIQKIRKDIFHFWNNLDTDIVDGFNKTYSYQAI